MNNNKLGKIENLEDVIFIDTHANEWMKMFSDRGNYTLRSNDHKVYKVKDVEIKKNKKYHIKCTCKEIGCDVETIKIFRLTAYSKVKNV